jgi:protocatechuate 3,4-dioxygenase beta subunit
MSNQLFAFFMTVIFFSVLLGPSFIDLLPTSFAQFHKVSTNQFSSNSGSMQLDLKSEPTLVQKTASVFGSCALTHSSKLHATPQQTEGPYFVDEMPNRSDIRTDSSDGSLQQGITLYLVIHVYGMNNGLCFPVDRAKVDIWHANSLGVYSSVNEMGTTGKNFLRGYQLTDENGTVRFTSIYPGWYPGRAIHIHDKVQIFNGSETNLEWTSQLYFNNTMNKKIHEQPPYSSHGPPPTQNEQDFIYAGPSTDSLVRNNSGKDLIMNVTKDGPEYLGTFNIFLNIG